MDTLDHSVPERRLGGALEPVIGSVYFAPEAHSNYGQLGFNPSPGERDGVAMPDGIAYATSRGSLLGDARGAVVAAAFAVFEPSGIAAAVEAGWTRTDAATICAAREQGALSQLERLLGPDPVGRDRVEELLAVAVEGLAIGARPLAAGAMAAPVADHSLGRIFRLGDVLREFRGDSHNAAWAAAGLDGPRIGLLTELFWGLPLRTYARTRGWSEEEFNAAEDELRAGGLIGSDGGFTDAGRKLREGIESATDQQMAPIMARLGADAEELIDLLTPWGAAIRHGGGYFQSGPHDLAAMAR